MKTNDIEFQNNIEFHLSGNVCLKANKGFPAIIVGEGGRVNYSWFAVKSPYEVPEYSQSNPHNYSNLNFNTIIVDSQSNPHMKSVASGAERLEAASQSEAHLAILLICRPSRIDLKKSRQGLANHLSSYSHLKQYLHF